MKVLEAKGIIKIFPGVIALNNVDVAFEPGKIHAIIGENGAGKSTLIKCITGVYIPESGNVIINEISAVENPNLFNKVAYVPQEIDLFNYMTVAENLFTPFEKTGIKGLINQKELFRKAVPLLEKFHINVPPDALISEISVSEQQLVQIARATVNENYEILMLDEPTTSLTKKDTEILFNIIEKIKMDYQRMLKISNN